MIIAIDGPAGSGKSTLAQMLAEKLNIEYIDSGAIYRTLAYFGKSRLGRVEGKEEEIARFFQTHPQELAIRYERHLQIMNLGGEDLDDEIRNREITREVKWVANHAACREIVNAKIRQTAAHYSCVIDGRDIGTVVFPEQKNKFFLNADPRIRAARRAKDLEIAEGSEEFEELVKEIVERDQSDMNRSLAPLKKAADAHEIDTTSLTPAQVLEEIQGKLV